MQSNSGFGVYERGGPMRAVSFERRDLLEHDVAVRTLFCGVCHSDLHAINDEQSTYPLVPGHEIVGEVIAVGTSVTAFTSGDRVMIGTIIDSCRVCDPCEAHIEQYCRRYPTTTYNGIDRIDGSRTKGGYSDGYVADERFVYHLPAGLDAAAAAPLLCAGITTYSPLRAWEIGPGKTVGIVGIGGLGHLAIKFARAMDAHVVAFTTSEKKRQDAFRLGAHEVVLSTDSRAMDDQEWRFDFVLDTVSQAHRMTPYLDVLKLDGTLCSLGIPDAFEFDPLALTMGRRRLTSSGVGGTRETRDMLAFCSEHGIVADVEVIAPEGIGEAFGRLARADVYYRFVLDMTRR